MSLRSRPSSGGNCRRLVRPPRAWTTWALLSIDDAPPDELVGVPDAIRDAAHALRRAALAAGRNLDLEIIGARYERVDHAGGSGRAPARSARATLDRPHRRRAHASRRGHRRVLAGDAGAVPGALQLVRAGHRADRTPGRTGARRRRRASARRAPARASGRRRHRRRRQRDRLRAADRAAVPVHRRDGGRRLPGARRVRHRPR